MPKRIIIILSIILLLCTMLSFPVYATDSECTVTVATVSGSQEDTVFVPITIKNNPGIMAITGTITYDASVLQYISYTKGTVFVNDFFPNNIPNKNMFKFVALESENDSTEDGDILTFQFKIKPNATAGLHKITFEYKNGDFANSQMQSVKPKFITGGVNVKPNANRDNCVHAEYSDWKTVLNATCTAKGAEQRECLICEIKQTRETDKIPHKYENKWTVDSPATKEKDGVMSRHCKHCTSKTQVLTFPFEEVANENINNSLGAEIPPNEFTGEIVEEPLVQNKSSSSSAVSNIQSSSKAASTSQEIISEIITSSKAESHVDKQESSSYSSDEMTSNNSMSANSNSTYKIISIVGIVLLVCLLIFIVIVATRKTK